MSNWIFIRHGQSVANAEGWFSGQQDPRLTLRGEEQARRLVDELGDTPIDRVLASDLERARRTAEIALGDRGLPIEIHSELRERCCGIHEGEAVETLQRNGGYDLLMTFDGRPPEGESLRDVALRTFAFLAERDGQAGTTAVVCHGALIRSVVGVLDGRPYEQLSEWKPQNCEVIQRQVMPGTWSRLYKRLNDS